ncbi:MAG: phage portal protein, partial [Ruminococcus sp.]|nr:phage portal protein [Ruminococcus sp.]
PLDLKADFTPIERKSEIVDTDALKFVDSKILRTWGIPECILNGDYTKEQFEAFYQAAIEDKVKTFSQGFTKGLFTKREKAFGNRVEFYPKDLIFMTVSQTLEMINNLAPTGAIFENEKRVFLGLRPLPELEGKRYMSLNWIEADKAAQYQVGKINVDVVDEDKTVTEE